MAPSDVSTQGARVNLASLKDMKIPELTKMARDLNVNGFAGLKKQDLIFKILQA